MSTHTGALPIWTPDRYRLRLRFRHSRSTREMAKRRKVTAERHCFERQPDASRRSVPIAGANPVAVGIVAAAAAIVGCPCRCRADGRCAHGRAGTVAVAAIAVSSAANGDGPATSPANRNRAAALTSRSNSTTAAITSSARAAAGICDVGRKGDQQHGCGCGSDENSTQHGRTPSPGNSRRYAPSR